MNPINPANMTGADVIAIARQRGYAVRLKPGLPPMPVLIKMRDNVEPPTEPLLNALRAFRRDILAELAKEAP